MGMHVNSTPDHCVCTVAKVQLTIFVLKIHGVGFFFSSLHLS